MEPKTVLFVDDEENILKSIKRMVIRKEFDSLFANSGQEALRIFEQHKIHVIVTDMRMPEMSGLELLKEVRIKYPQVIRIVLSGYTHITTLLTAINQGEIFRYITKPWENESDVLNPINQAFEQYEMQHSLQLQTLGELFKGKTNNPA